MKGPVGAPICLPANTMALSQRLCAPLVVPICSVYSVQQIFRAEVTKLLFKIQQAYFHSQVY